MAWFGNINVSSSFLMHKKKASSGIHVILTEELGAHVSVCVCVCVCFLWFGWRIDRVTS